MQIEKIRLIHKAFEHHRKYENIKNHIATYVPNNNKNVLENLEDLYSRTQNIDWSWIKDQSNFSMIPTTDQRSTSVGDLAVVCYENTKGNGYKEVVYRCEDVGWEKWFDKQHIANDHLKEKYKKGGTA
jgi:hypothetical protein